MSMNPINEAAERAAFEAAAYKLHTDMYFNLRQDGEYKHGLARDLWAMWQAARASLPPASGEVVAWAAFADNGNIRVWTSASEDVRELAESVGMELVPLCVAQPAAPEMQASHGAVVAGRRGPVVPHDPEQRSGWDRRGKVAPAKD